MKAVTFATALLLALSFLPLGAAAEQLTPVEYLPTSGAREITPFTLDGEHYLAAAQLAEDIPDAPPSMDGGNSDVDVLIFKRQTDGYVIYQRIPGYGNEGAAFFTLGQDAFLAVASIRSGARAPYNMNTYSTLYRWDGQYFYPVQQFSTFAAKQLHPFSIGTRFFLAAANGVSADGAKPSPDAATNSMIYEWNDGRFLPFQAIASRWGYSFEKFEIDRMHFLAFADHLGPSTLFRWDGKAFVPTQAFDGVGGRAFKHFTIDQKHYLAYANLARASSIYRWNGERFTLYQTLDGAGGRNFAYFDAGEDHYLFRVNFITGDRTSPRTALRSPLYRWQGDRFVAVQAVPTFGGVSAHVFAVAGTSYLVIANSLDADARFRVDSAIYCINPQMDGPED